MIPNFKKYPGVKLNLLKVIILVLFDIIIPRTIY